MVIIYSDILFAWQFNLHDSKVKNIKINFSLFSSLEISIPLKILKLTFNLLKVHFETHNQGKIQFFFTCFFFSFFFFISFHFFLFFHKNRGYFYGLWCWSVEFLQIYPSTCACKMHICCFWECKCAKCWWMRNYFGNFFLDPLCIYRVFFFLPHYITNQLSYENISIFYQMVAILYYTVPKYFGRAMVSLPLYYPALPKYYK